MSNYKIQSPIDSRNAGIRNELLVLNILRTHGQMSQSGLCRQADLSSSTVSYIIGRLREKNLIIEVKDALQKGNFDLVQKIVNKYQEEDIQTVPF